MTMLFGHPSMQSHMRAGDMKALASSKTPAHLKKHLKAKLARGAQPMRQQPQQVDPDAYDDLQDAATTGNDDPQNEGDLQNLRPAVRPLRTTATRLTSARPPMKKLKKKKMAPVRPGSLNKEMFFGRG